MLSSQSILKSDRRLPCNKKRQVAVDRSDRIGEIEGLVYLDPRNHEEPSIRIKRNVQPGSEMRQHHRLEIRFSIRRRFHQIGDSDVDEEVVVHISTKFRPPHDLPIGEPIPDPLGQPEGEVLTQIHLDSRFQRGIPRKEAGTPGNPRMERRSSCPNLLEPQNQEDEQDSYSSHNPLSPIPY